MTRNCGLSWGATIDSTCNASMSGCRERESVPIVKVIKSGLSIVQGSHRSCRGRHRRIPMLQNKKGREERGKGKGISMGIP